MDRNNKCKISIIIATFNSGHTLRNALDSVYNQSFHDYECIVIDGDSKDNTLDIIKEYSSKDSRFSYISEPDTGIYNAFNKGWRIAKGEWVYYLGSDDELISDGLYMLLSAPKSSTADIIYGRIKLVDGKGFHKDCILAETDVDKIKIPGHQSLITRRCVIEKMGGFDENYKILGDKDLTFSILKNNGIFIPVNTFVATFSIGGMSSSQIKQSFKENLYFINKHKLPFRNKLLTLYGTCRRIIRKLLFGRY